MERITRKRVETLFEHFVEVMGLPKERTKLDYAACYGGYQIIVAPEDKPYNIEYTVQHSRLNISEMYYSMHFALNIYHAQKRYAVKESN